MRESIIIDCMNYIHPDIATDITAISVGSGVLVGVVSGIMACKKKNLYQSIDIIIKIMSERYDMITIVKECIPESWVELFDKYPSVKIVKVNE